MIHVAVLLKPYLDLVLDGSKTVECRLTRQQRPPFGEVEAGERIYFKQSAGPYRAMAIVEHVIFEDDLTPRRISAMRASYNEFIHGDADYWKAKRSSLYASLIWLKDVEATDNGPAIRPLQGAAWMTLEEDTAWRRVGSAPARAKPAKSSFEVEVTGGNLRNSTLQLTPVLDRFPSWSIGGSSRRDAGRPVTLLLHDGPHVKTDIAGSHNMLRTRVWGAWFRRHGVCAGDRVVFTPVDEATYFVGLAKRQSGTFTARA